MGKDYYKILGVEKNAPPDDLKKAYRRLAHQYHPDKQGGDEAKFKEINEAYQVLGDEKKRAQYDQFGSTFEQAQAGGGFSGFEGFRDFSGFANGFNVNIDDFGDIFGGLGEMFGFGGRKAKERARRGRDLELSLRIDFSEAVFGAEREINLKKLVACDICGGTGVDPKSAVETCRECGGKGTVIKMQRTILGQMKVEMTCGACQGEGKKYARSCAHCREGAREETVSLKVKIPAGVDDGQIIKLSGQGEAGRKGAPAGDLYLKIKVNPDRRFRREGDNIFSRLSIGFRQAALGDKIEVETVDGAVNLKIPAGTQSGTVFKLSGRGVPHISGRGRGDHLAEVVVKTPTNLTRQQKKILEELEA